MDGTFDFLKDLPQREDDWPTELRQEIAAYTKDFEDHDGLIPKAAAPELLQVSRQRLAQLEEEYGFFKVTYFEKVWYSRRELEDFYKVRRVKGQGVPSLKKVAKAMADDLLHD